MSTLAVAFDVLARDRASGVLNKVGKETEKTHKTLASFAGGLTGGAIGGAITDFAKGATNAFAEVEDATGAAGVEFGKQLPIITKFAEGAATAFGLSKAAALDAANTFGTFGKGAGLAGPQLATFSTKLTGLAADLASFKGTSTEQAIEAVGAALRGESEPIRAYGVLLDDATLKAEALALGLLKPTVASSKVAAANTRVEISTIKLSKAIKAHGATSIEAKSAQAALTSAHDALSKATEGTIGPLTQQQKVLATQSLLFKRTKDAQGDYARTSTSTANTQKTLDARMQNLQVTLGQKLAPAVTKVKNLLIQSIDFYEKNASVIKPLVIVLGGLGAAIFTVIKAVKIYTAVQEALDVVLAANPIGLIVVAIAALAAGFVIAYKHSQTFRDIVAGAFTALISPVSVFLLVIQKTFEALGHVPGFGWAKDAANAIKKVRGELDSVADSIRNIPPRKTVDIVLRGVTSAGVVRGVFRDSDVAPKPRHALGGGVYAGRSVVVGEKGPEEFVPDSNGRIVPTVRSGQAIEITQHNYGVDHVEANRLLSREVALAVGGY